ncbi:MAG: BatD family protein, partial [Candidatus Nanoarchaeia archaeon]
MGNAANSDLFVEVEPLPALQGEAAVLKLTSSLGKPELLEFPSITGIKWLSKTPSVSTEVKIINFKRSDKYVCSYTFVPLNEGKIQIPPLKIQLNDRKIISDPIEFDVVARRVTVPGARNVPRQSRAQGQSQQDSGTASLDELLFLRADILSSKKEVYVGEEVPLEIRLYVANGLRCKPSWPVLNIENVVFKDFSSINPENGRFSGYRTVSETIGGRLYDVFVFRTAFRAVAAGEIRGTAEEKCVLQIPRERRRGGGGGGFFDPFDDDFFPSFFSNYEEVPRELSVEIPSLKIKSLPPAPTQSHFLGLVGNWTITPKLSSEKLRAGEPVTLKLEIIGEGTLETLRAPEITVHGFRVYPPEIGKSENIGVGKLSTEINYILIPLEEGPANINLEFCYFSTDSMSYIPVSVQKKFIVEKGETKLSDSGIATFSVTSSEAEAPKKKKHKANGLLGPKKGQGREFVLPIWQNRIAFVAIIFILSLLLPAVAEFARFWKERLNADPLMRRRIAARNRRGKIFSEIRRANDSNIHEVIRDSVVPYLIDCLGLPPGTSISELSKKIESRELAECLKEGEASAYMPGSMSGADLKKRLLAELKRLSFLFAISAFLFIGIDSFSAEENQSFDPLTAYYDANFAKAAEYYQNKLDIHRPDPVLLYNLADCLYQLNQLPQALLCLERASRLSPRDSDIFENLNHVRRKLLLPEKGRIEHPADIFVFLRDFLRPDEWLLLASLL